MYIFAVCALIAISLLFLINIIFYRLYQKKLSRTENKIKLKRINKDNYLQLVCSLCWIFICLGNCYTYLDRGDIKRADGYFILIFVWIIAFIMYLLYFLFENYAYITDYGVIAFKLKLKKEYTKYKTDGDILELYYKSRYKPIKLQIPESRDDLFKMLEENFLQYEDLEE